MESMPSEEVLARVDAALLAKQAIEFSEPMPDDEHPEILWTIFGLIETNEIAVVTRCGSARVGVCSPSPLFHPGMADRIFGIDVSDMALARELSDTLWLHHGQTLVAAAKSSGSS
jgi:hypothetical protein